MGFPGPPHKYSRFGQIIQNVKCLKDPERLEKNADAAWTEFDITDVN